MVWSKRAKTGKVSICTEKTLTNLMRSSRESRSDRKVAKFLRAVCMSRFYVGQCGGSVLK